MCTTLTVVLRRRPVGRDYRIRATIFLLYYKHISVSRGSDELRYGRNSQQVEQVAPKHMMVEGLGDGR
jgi:hypothetical protein